MSVRVTGRRIAFALTLACAVLGGAATAAAEPGARGSTAAAAKMTLVFCAPGSPGTAEEAQGAMDAFAAALAQRAGLRDGTLAATYAPTEAAGVARVRQADAAAALVSLPFFLVHQKELRLAPAGLQAVMADGAAGTQRGTERWSLVAARGRVSGPAALDGFTIVSTAGYAPAFVRAALAGYGALPQGVKIAASAAVLSALRRAAAGEQVAVLLDGAQASALAGLAFAADLEVLARSDPWPVGVVTRVEKRVSPSAWTSLERALRTLHEGDAGASALAGIRVARFEPLDEAALAAARKAFAEAR